MKNKYIFFLIFLINILNIKIFSIQNLENNLVIEKNIDFLIEIQDGLFVEGTQLDFGDIVRGTKNIIKKENFLKVNGFFNQDMEISIDFLEDEMEEQGNYVKFKIFPESVEEIEDKDFIEVYIEKIEKFELKVGEKNIPIKGEIRDVGGNVMLGRYSRTLKVSLEIKSIDPTLKLDRIK